MGGAISEFNCAIGRKRHVSINRNSPPLTKKISVVFPSGRRFISVVT